MLTSANETLTFNAADAATTYLNLIDRAKGDVPWWAIGDRRDWTPACIGDTTPLKGAERAVVTAAILSSPTGCHLGRWWQDVHLAVVPRATIEVATPSLRRLRPCEPSADEANRDATNPVDLTSIIDQLLTGIATSDGAAHISFPTNGRGALTMPAEMPLRRTETELAALLERIAMMHARMDHGMLSDDVLDHLLACGLATAFVLSSLGVDPCMANTSSGAQLTYDLAHTASFDADRRLASLIGAADAAERMAERILEPVQPFVCDIMAEQPRAPAPSRAITGPDTPSRDSCTLDQVVAQTQRVARLLDHSGTCAS